MSSECFALLRLLFGWQLILQEQATPVTGRTTQVVSLERYANSVIIKATAMVCVILALIFFATISLIATASRMTWAFARDDGLPGSNWFSKVRFPSSCKYIPIFCGFLSERLSSYRSNLARLCLSTLLVSQSSLVFSSPLLTLDRPRLSTPSFPSAS